MSQMLSDICSVSMLDLLQIIRNNIVVDTQTVKQLQQRGHRLTKQREMIYDALSDYPQSVSDIQFTLESRRLDINTATVYRTLDYFTGIGLVGKTQFRERETRYELLTQGRHHHHIVCNVCGMVENIPLDESDLLAKVKKKTHFTVTSHTLEFFGLCIRCKNYEK